MNRRVEYNEENPQQEAQTLIDQFEREGLPEAPDGVGYTWLSGLTSVANGGEMNYRGTRLVFDKP